MNAAQKFAGLTVLFLASFINLLPGQGKWEHYTTSNSGLLDNAIRSIAFAQDGSTWIGTDWGLAHLADTTWNVYLSSNSPLPDNSVRSLAMDNQNRLWIGTFNGGLAIKDDTTWTIYDPGNSLIPDYHIRAIGFEPGGKAWIATTGGIVSIEDTTFEVFNLLNTPELWSNNYTSVAIDTGDNSKWFGSINGGVATWNDTIWVVRRTANSGIPDNTILDVEFDRNNNLWISTPAAGITLFDRTNWLYFNVVNSTIPTNSVNAISLCPFGDLYAGSIDKGLLQFRAPDTWRSFTTDSFPILDNHLITVEFDPEGRIWAGTISSGVSIYSPEIYPIIVDSQLNAVDTFVFHVKNDTTRTVCLDVQFDDAQTFLSVIDSPALGQVILQDGLCFTYQPQTGVVGSDQMLLLACITQACMNQEFCDTVTLLFEVEEMDSVPLNVPIVSKNEVQVYPTLFTNDLFIKCDNLVEKPVKIELFDLFGQHLVYFEKSIGNNTIHIQTADVPAGSYFLSIVYPHNTLIKKILKLH